jgi:glyoxylate/hydroxypyruvate reductase A
MDILLHIPSAEQARWHAACERYLPHARVRLWQEGDDAPADFALVWRPPAALFKRRAGLRAIFNLGAGVDAILALERAHPGTLPAGVPLIRLDDAGMAQQMVEYASHAVLHFFRRNDDYERQQAQGIWQPLPAYRREDFTIGVMGLGRLGARVAAGLRAFGFPLRGWSRNPRRIEGIACHAGAAEFDAFLQGCKVLVNLLPHTADTQDILNRHTFARLAAPAYLVNVARGAHLVEADLLAAIAEGRIAGAALDVFREEPLAPAHPFWREPRIRITPHVSALTLPEESIEHIAGKIAALASGAPVSGIVDLQRGY